MVGFKNSGGGRARGTPKRLQRPLMLLCRGRLQVSRLSGAICVVRRSATACLTLASSSLPPCAERSLWRMNSLVAETPRPRPAAYGRCLFFPGFLSSLLASFCWLSGNDFGRPSYEMNDDGWLDDHTYMIVGLRASTASAVAERDCTTPASAVTAAAVS